MTRIKIYAGMTADDLADLLKQHEVKPRKDPEKIGADAYGMIVMWFLPQHDVTLHYRQGRYVVSKIVRLRKQGNRPNLSQKKRDQKKKKKKKRKKAQRTEKPAV